MPSFDESTAIAVHLMIHGRVQGVWYRASFQQAAQQLGLTGWCCNRMDGCVEALVQGTAGKVEQLIQWAHQGPPQAQVTHIDKTPKPVNPELLKQSQFEVRAKC